MADENQTNDVNELASTPEQVEETVTEVTEVAEETAEAAIEAAEVVEEVTEAAEETTEEVEVTEVAEDAQDVVAATADEVDEKVEAAVRHVAEEAEAQAAAAQQLEDEIPPEQAYEETPKKRERRSKQARAEKEARSSAVEQAPASTGARGLAGLGTSAWIAISLACLALGLVLGRFVLSGGGAAGSISLTGKTTVSEAELDNAFASYTYDGKTETISVREVIEQNGTLDAALTDDGTYKVPSAEYAMNVARTEILNKEIEKRGIEVADEDVAAYAEKALGTSDYDAIAATYGMEADAVKKLIEENCRITKLREEIVGTETPEAPAAPTEAAEGQEDALTKEYADYIIALAGDEWDSKKGTWASEDSAYATALADSGFTADGASYTMAQTAYYVAYQKYTEQQTELSNTWTEFLNGLLSNATIQVGTLIS